MYWGSTQSGDRKRSKKKWKKNIKQKYNMEKEFVNLKHSKELLLD